MTMQQVFLWAKKLHRLFMWLAVLLGIPLALTGLLMEDGEGYGVRALHRLVSTPFAAVLLLMMVTGLLIWGVPKILSKRVKE